MLVQPESDLVGCLMLLDSPFKWISSIVACCPAISPMPLPTHLLVASACWWWVSHVAPRLHHTNQRPRLPAGRPLIAARILTRRHCANLLRVTTAEFKQLCDLLFASLDELPVGNWRFTPRERIAIALYCLANYQPLRKAQVTFGWSIASLSENIHAFVDVVIERLDDETSGSCSPHAPACFLCSTR